MNSSSRGAKAPVMSLRTLVAAAMFTAVSYVLYLLGFKIAFVPFVTMDFSDLPAVMASLAFGPAAGVIVCALKNLLHLAISHTMWVGELSNFILGATFCLTAGLIYNKNKTKKMAAIALAIAVVVTAVVSVLSNYFIIYPLYAKLVIPMEFILKTYVKILPSVKNLFQALLIFNFPFTIVKELVCAVVAFIVYKPVSRVIKNSDFNR